MNHWWRAYNEAVNDPKLQLISDSLFRAWFNLMCIASANEGALPAVSSLAFTLRMKPEKVLQILTQLHGVGLLDKTETGFTPHNWKGRQYKSDVSTERVKRFRETKRNVSSAVPVTPPEAEQKQNTEQSRADARAGIDRVEVDLSSDIAKAFVDRGREQPALSRVALWLSKGYAPSMVLDVVKELLARNPTVSSLNYFDAALAERHTNQPMAPSERAAASASIDMDKIAALYAKTGVWSKYAGPEPGMIGCRCPAEILQKHGIAVMPRRMDA